MKNGTIHLLILVLLGSGVYGTPPTEFQQQFDKAGALYDAEENEASYEAFEALQAAIQVDGDTSSILYALSFMYQGSIVFSGYGDISTRSADLFERGLALCKQFNHKHVFISTAGACLGYFYTIVDMQLDKAQGLLRTALTLFPSDSLPTRNLMIAYHTMGSVYARKRDFDQAISYYERAINLRDSTPNNKELYGVGLRSVLAFSYEIIERNEEARVIYTELSQDQSLPYYKRCDAMMGIAYILYEESKYEEAKRITKKAINDVLAANGGDSLDGVVIGGLEMLADIAIDQKEYKKAIQYYKKSVDFTSDTLVDGPDSRVTAKQIFYLASAYREASMDSLALETYHKALSIFAPYYKPASVYELPNIRDDDKEAFITHCLREKARLFIRKYAATKDPRWLHLSIDHSLLAISQLEKIVFNLNHRVSNAYLIEQDYNVFQHGLSACHYLYQETGEAQYIERALQFMEQGKAMLLHKNAALGNFNEVAEVQSKLDSINDKVAQLRITSKQKDQPGAKEASKLLAALEVEADLLRAQSKEDRAVKAWRQRQNAPLLLSQIQQKALQGPDHGLLHYFVTEGEIFTVFIQPSQSSFASIPLDSGLTGTIESFRQSITQVPPAAEAKSRFEQYKKQASSLYALLLKPFIGEEAAVQQLTIIPHGILNTIPFESLIRSDSEEYSSYEQLPYLVKTHTISYAYSATSLFQEWAAPVKPTILAIAPSFSGTIASSSRSVDSVRGNLASLEWTAEEARKVHALYGGNLLLGEDASEALFKEQAAESGIIHIASHALLHEIEPTLSRILFNVSADSAEDGSLFLEEIFNMDFSNKLVCLSACNTAWGKLTKSDGLMSLARGFHYAGSPSLVGTLWQAHDRSSYLLSTGFHRQVKSGKSLDKAMQAAKLEYLREADALKGHPYYWAQMVVIGETGLQFDQPDYVKRSLWALVFLGLFVSVFFMLRRESR